MSPKGVYPHTHIKPREYPSEVVEQVRRLFIDEGMTVAEVGRAIGPGFKAQNIIERHVPAEIRAARRRKREQRGERNSTWKGDEVSYGGVHVRLVAVHGKASEHTCADCGCRAHEWSYEGGCPNERRDPSSGCRFTPDLDRYRPRCRSCHRKHDRKAGGEDA